MDVQGITIDGLGTREREKAIWAEIDARGWTVTVCVANIAAAISKGSAFDLTAHRRVEASHFPGSYSRPLLPRRFSEGSCSITQGKRRSVMAIRIRLDHEFEIRSVSIDESLLVNYGQLYYEDVSSVLETKDGKYYPIISRLKSLAENLFEIRRNRGAIVARDALAGWMTTEEGHLQKVENKNLVIGRLIVQELMILTNTELARFCVENNVPVLFRNHEARAATPDRRLITEKIDLSLQNSANDIDAVCSHIAMMLQKSNYSPFSTGHYGLNLPAYMHGTSPMQRFSDLVSQRQILAHINKLKYPYSQEEILEISNHINSTTENRAKELAQISLERANRKSSIRKDDLTNLSDKEFWRMLKSSLRSNGLNDRILDSFLTRLRTGKSTISEMQFVLFHSNDSWKPGRQAIIDHLSEYPYKAPAIAAIASQIEGWSEPSFKTHREGRGREMIHVAQAWFKKPGLESDLARASNGKAAKQRAIVGALAKFANLNLKPWSDQDVALNQSLPMSESSNAVNELSEYCHKIGEAAPSYDIERDGGKDHSPFFIATCRALDLCVKSTPQTSKRSAKKMAALAIIGLLHMRIKNQTKISES